MNSSKLFTRLAPITLAVATAAASAAAPGQAESPPDTELLPVRAEAEDTVVELNWDAPAGRRVQGYRVYIGGSHRPDHGLQLLSETEYAALDLDNRRAYTFEVRAVLESGEELPCYRRVAVACCASYKVIDLAGHANRSLGDDRHAHQGNSLHSLPRGELVLGGVKLHVAQRMIQLSSPRAPDFPEAARGIEVGAKADRIHFLHATGWGPGEVDEGAEIGHYLIHYVDGSSLKIPLQYGRDVRDWWARDKNAADRARLVWNGENVAAANAGFTLRLYLRSWENPKRDLQISNLDFVSNNSTVCAPFLVAVSLERHVQAAK